MVVHSHDGMLCFDVAVFTDAERATKHISCASTTVLIPTFADALSHPCLADHFPGDFSSWA
jgi:hypothetical protein